LKKIKQRINENINQLGKVVYKHVLRVDNQAADALANKAVDKEVGIEKENNAVYKNSIP